MELINIFKIETGYLKSRVKESENGLKVTVFTKRHFDSNLAYEMLPKTILEDYLTLDKDKYPMTNEGDIIVDSLSTKACLITKETSGMFIPFNYFVLRPISEININKDYFVAWFNLSKEVSLQLSRLLQGTVIKKLSLRQLEKIKIELPNLNEQNKIALIYSTSNLKYAKAKENKEVEFDIIKNLLEEQDSGI